MGQGCGLLMGQDRSVDGTGLLMGQDCGLLMGQDRSVDGTGQVC